MRSPTLTLSQLSFFLHSNRLVPLEWDVLELDIGFPVNDKGQC